MRLRHTLVIAALAAQSLSATGLQAQTPVPPSTGAITGVVVDGATGTAIADVVVTLSGGTLPPGYPARQLSDARGRFAFMNLPDAETFLVATAKFGFLDGGYGRDSGPTDQLRPIVVRNGDVAGNLRVPVWRPAVISGAVRDESGEPVVGVFVRALVRIRIAGRDDLAAGPVTVTDDRGQYRLPGLIPGRYLIQVPSVQAAVPASTTVPLRWDAPGRASLSNVPEGAIDADDSARLVIGRYPLPPPRAGNRAMAYGVAFHPSGSAIAQAANIDLEPGDDRAAVDVALTPVPGVRVSGTVEAPPEALTSLTLRLLPAGLESLGNGSEVATALVAGDGTFTFLNVPAGTYTLDAPVKVNEFTLARISQGATVSFSSRNTQLPPPPPGAGWGRNSNSVDAVPGLSMESTSYRGSVPQMSGRMSIAVGATDVSGLVMRLRPSATVRGRVVLEADPSKPAPPKPLGISLALDPATGQPGLGLPNVGVAPGQTTFEIPGVQPGEYWIRATYPAGWLIKSAQWRDRDLTKVPLDAAGADDLTGVVVTVTNATPLLTGGVRAQNGAVPTAGIVVAFPANPAERVNTGLLPARLKSTVMQSNGSFQFTTLPAGDYYVAAIEPSRSANWRDPEFLAGLERAAARVTLAWGQTATRDVTMVISR